MMHYEVRNIYQAFTYLLNCTLATVEHLASIKRPTKYDLSRHINISQVGINHLINNNLEVSETRLKKVLQANGSVAQWANRLRPESLPALPEASPSSGRHSNTAESILLYLTDCTLATVSRMAMKKRRTKSEYARQITIAQHAVDWIREYNLDPAGTRAEEVLKNGSAPDAVERWAKQYEGQ